LPKIWAAKPSTKLSREPLRASKTMKMTSEMLKKASTEEDLVLILSIKPRRTLKPAECKSISVAVSESAEQVHVSFPIL
jgi:hypothetical protein